MVSHFASDSRGFVAFPTLGFLFQVVHTKNKMHTDNIQSFHHMHNMCVHYFHYEFSTLDWLVKMYNLTPIITTQFTNKLYLLCSVGWFNI